MAVTDSLLIFRPLFYFWRCEVQLGKQWRTSGQTALSSVLLFMDARAVLLHLWTVVLLKATLNWADAAEIYANTWAVQIDGGPEEADRIAREHGFINHGNVSCICMTPCALWKRKCALKKIRFVRKSGASEADTTAAANCVQGIAEIWPQLHFKKMMLE